MTRKLLLIGLGVGVLFAPSLAQVTIRPKPVNAVRVLCASAVAVSAAADTTENVLATCTVPANALGLSGTLRITTTWAYTNSANTKTLRVRYSGAAGTAFTSLAPTTTASAYLLTLITNRNATNAQIGGALSTGLGFSASSGVAVTASVVTTADTTVVITGQKTVSGETLTLDRYLVELIVL